MARVALAAARYRLGLENGESLRDLGVALLSEDGVPDAVTRLAIVDDLAMSEVGPVFESACSALALSIPTRDDAIEVVTKSIVSDIADSAVDPRAGLQRLMDDIYYPHLAGETNTGDDRYVGESHGLQKLIGAYWAYDELRARPTEVSIDGKYGDDAVPLLDDSVRASAREWLADHPSA